MSRKRIPKGRVRRTVMLDRELLLWAVNALRDHKYDVEQRGVLVEEWDQAFSAVDKHLNELREASERA